MYQTTFQHTFQYTDSLEMLCKNLEEYHVRLCQGKCSPLFTATVFKANLLFFKENNVSANRLSGQFGTGHVLATAHFTCSYSGKKRSVSKAGSQLLHYGLKVSYKIRTAQCYTDQRANLPKTFTLSC